MSQVTEPEQTQRAPESAPESAPVREIGHDEFDPIGTLALVGLYFLIVALLWVFMYFVEFLGNGPTVIGSIAPVVGSIAPVVGLA